MSTAQKNFHQNVIGTISPYQTVVIVTIPHQSASGTDENELFTPFSNTYTNVEKIMRNEENIPIIHLYSGLYCFTVLINHSAMGDWDDTSKSLSIRKILSILSTSNQARGANMSPIKNGPKDKKSIMFIVRETKNLLFLALINLYMYSQANTNDTRASRINISLLYTNSQSFTLSSIIIATASITQAWIKPVRYFHTLLFGSWRIFSYASLS